MLSVYFQTDFCMYLLFHGSFLIFSTLWAGGVLTRGNSQIL